MLRDQIQADQIAALKSGDKQKLETLRFILAQIKNKEIDKKAPLDDEETVNALRKQIKEINESVEAFTKAGRPETAAEYQAQSDVLSVYLPAEISDEELQEEVKKLIEANQDLYQKNKSAVIGIAMKQLRSKAAPERIMKTLQSL
jgi:uncharacterized protein YqeY